MAPKKSAHTPVTAEQARAWHRQHSAERAALSAVVEKALVDLLRARSIPFALVSSRTKGEKELVQKAVSKKYWSLEQQMTDFTGARVILLRETDVTQACKMLSESFHVHPRMSGDKASLLGADRFGYRSIHYVCDLGKDRLRLQENKRFHGLRFEIQVRTVLQHAWAEIEHKVYKGKRDGPDVPVEMRRRFSRIAALLETADGELEQVVSEIGRHEAQQAKLARTKLSPTEPLGEPWMLGFVHGVAAKFKLRIAKGQADTPAMLSELSDFGISHTGSLADLFDIQFLEICRRTLRKYVNTEIGILRDAMMFRDIDAYFEKAWKSRWAGMDTKTYLWLCERHGQSLVDRAIRKHKIDIVDEDDTD